MGASAAPARSAASQTTIGWPAALALALLCGFVMQVPDLLFQRVSWNLDLGVHYHYAREYALALDAGQWRPRWAWMAQDGLGEPGLLYYAPLYYYLAWAVSHLTGNVWQAMQWVEIASAGLLGWSVWRLTSESVPSRLALLAIPVAVFSPMLALLHLGFNGYPWASATGPLGLLVWALFRQRARSLTINGWAIFALALVICTHTVTGLMAVIMVAACGIPPLLRRPLGFWRERDFLMPLIVALGGLALSSWYLLPAFASQGLIDAGVWRQNYTPFNAFSLSTVTAWAFGIRWFAFQWPISLLSIGASALALWWLWWGRSREAVPHWFAPVVAVVGVVAFLSTELSYPLWLIDSPLRNIQFPHRLITVLVPIMPVVLVTALARVAGWKRWVVLGAMVVSCAMGGIVIAKAALVDGEVLPFAETELAPYTGLDEYRTQIAADRGMKAGSFDWAAECARIRAICATGAIDATGRSWTVETRRAGAVRLPLYAFPSWQVQVNGRDAAWRADDRFGLVEVALPPGTHLISVRWKAMPAEWIGAAISLAMAALMLLFNLVASRKTQLPA